MEQMIETRKADDAAMDRALGRRMLHIGRIMATDSHGMGTRVKTVTIDTDGRACTDGENVWIPSSMGKTPEQNLIMQEAVLAHEIAGHHRYTDFTVWNNEVVKKIKNGTEDPLLHQFVNCLEDSRINHLLSQDFPGSGKRMDYTHAVFMARHKAHTTDLSPQKQQAMVAMMSETIAHEAHWFTTPEVVAWMDENRALMQNACSQPDTRGVVKQAKRVLASFRKAFPEEEMDPNMNGGYDGNGGDNAEGTSAEMESQSDIERAAQAQQQNGGEPEKVSKNRFNDKKQKLEKSLDEQKENQQGDSSPGGESSDAEGDDPDGGLGGDEDGEADGDAEGGMGGDGDGGEEADGAGSECDGAADGEGDGDGGESSDGEADGQGDESDANNDGEDGCGGEDFNPFGDAENMDDFTELWADLQGDARASLDSMDREALDEQIHHEEDMQRALDEVEHERISVEGHSLEIVAGATDMFQYDYEHNSHQLINGNERYNGVKEENRSGIQNLVNEIKRQLKGRNSRMERGLKRGRVTNKDIWKVNQTGAKMFQRRAIPKKVDASAIILIDSSGSMGGRKSACAADAAVVFSEVMHAVGVDYEVIDFCTGRGTTMRVRKALDSTLGETEKAVISNPTSGGCNADGYAVQWCLDRLRTRQGAKMLFVLSDGQPTDGGPGGMHAGEWLRKVVGNAGKDVALAGVGIQSDAVTSYYDNCIVVNDARELAGKMLPVMRGMLNKIVV
jgi:hypothetical protein